MLRKTASGYKVVAMRNIVMVVMFSVSVTVSGQKPLFCHASQKVFLPYYDSSRTICLADNYLFWNVGVVLKIKFMNGSDAIHERITKVAKEWEQYGNIRFEFIENGEAHIRIRLHDEGFLFAALGIQSNIFPQDEASVQMDTTLFNNEQQLRAVVLHMFGHVMGFQHENIVPFHGRKWNLDKINPYFKKFGWDDERIQSNLISAYSVAYSNMITPDPLSVLNIHIPYEWTGEKNKKWNTELSEGDKSIVQLLYPDTPYKKANQSRLWVSGVAEIRIHQDKKGFTFFPELMLDVKDIQSLTFTVWIVDEEGNPVYSAMDEPAASSLVYLSPGDKRYALNAGANDLGFFISSELVPSSYKIKKLKIIFCIYYVDQEHERKLGYRSKPYDFIWSQ